MRRLTLWHYSCRRPAPQSPVFLDDDVAFLRDWQAYLQRELGRPVVFVQRRSYRDVSELLLVEKDQRNYVVPSPNELR